MPDLLAYLWKLCRSPRHPHGTYAALLGIPNARHPAFKQKQCQNLRHTNKPYADNLARHQIIIPQIIDLLSEDMVSAGPQAL